MITADFGLPPANTADTIPVLLPLHTGSLYIERVYIVYAKAEEKNKDILADLIFYMKSGSGCYKFSGVAATGEGMTYLVYWEESGKGARTQLHCSEPQS